MAQPEVRLLPGTKLHSGLNTFQKVPCQGLTAVTARDLTLSFTNNLTNSFPSLLLLSELYLVTKMVEAMIEHLMTFVKCMKKNEDLERMRPSS